MTTAAEGGREDVEATDLFYSAWAKAYIRVNHAHDLETAEILLSLGQSLMRKPVRRRDHARLDLVMATMLRAALLAAKAAYDNLRSGVYEPALGQLRTLLELDLSLQYMLADEGAKSRRADRYLARAYEKRMGPLREELTTEAPEVKGHLDEDRIAWINDRIRLARENMEALSEATAENDRDRDRGGWHSYRGVKGLARHLGRLDDYLMLYAPMSNMNVHAADPETHVVIARDVIRIKALATTEPRVVRTALKLLAGWLEGFLRRFVDEWSLAETPLGGHMIAARMRFIGEGDGRIPAELKPEEWAGSIRVTQAPLGDSLEESLQLILVLVDQAPAGLTEAELRERTGVDALRLGENGHAILRNLLDGLVALAALRIDRTADPPRYKIASAREEAEMPQDPMQASDYEEWCRAQFNAAHHDIWWVKGQQMNAAYLTLLSLSAVVGVSRLLGTLTERTAQLLGVLAGVVVVLGSYYTWDLYHTLVRARRAAKQIVERFPDPGGAFAGTRKPPGRHLGFPLLITVGFVLAWAISLALFKVSDLGTWVVILVATWIVFTAYGLWKWGKLRNAPRALPWEPTKNG